MVEGARLERVYAGNRIEGSNPSLSATQTAQPVSDKVCGLQAPVTGRFFISNPDLHPVSGSLSGGVLAAICGPVSGRLMVG